LIAGTKVQTASGEVNIEDIKVGDVVLSSDPERSETVDQPSMQRVTRVYVRTASVILDIQIDGDVVSATPEHPFWVVGKGWQEAGQLERGSQLLTKNGKIVQVGSVNRREGSFKVHNFEVEHSHTYFVSRQGILVHNKCGPTGRAPEYFGGQVSESQFLNSAERYLGSGYGEFSTGRFISSDGMRQVRFGPHETRGPRLHGHFEAYDKSYFKGGRVIENTFVNILP
jgi:Pretoxin HINT domain